MPKRKCRAREGPTGRVQRLLDTSVSVRGRGDQVCVDRNRARHVTTVKWSYTVSLVETDTVEGSARWRVMGFNRERMDMSE